MVRYDKKRPHNKEEKDSYKECVVSVGLQISYSKASLASRVLTDPTNDRRFRHIYHICHHSASQLLHCWGIPRDQQRRVIQSSAVDSRSRQGWGRVCSVG